jgi:hypothetical protein
VAAGVRKSQINALITNNFTEFTQPNIEWHLQRTFGEHADPAASAGIASMHEFRVNFLDARFMNVSDYANVV